LLPHHVDRAGAIAVARSVIAQVKPPRRASVNMNSVQQSRDSQEVIFECNICNTINETTLDQLDRETSSCSKCRSSVRYRAVIRALTKELFGRNVNIPEIRPKHFEIRGCGLSCWDGYASRLKRHVDFRNTFFHRAPRLDITNIDQENQGELDFLIASEVFEHIEPPVQRAFNNARKLLKEDGVLVITVPFTNPGEQGIPMQEHYPDLFDYKIMRDGDSFILENATREGMKQIHRDLKFHGGSGNTLEMRVFSEYSLISSLRAAGFEKITIHGDADLAHGIRWTSQCSVPVTARVKEAPPRFVRAHKPHRWEPSVLQKIAFLGNRTLMKLRLPRSRGDI
jgi:SAM-dependent methyltransferase